MAYQIKYLMKNKQSVKDSLVNLTDYLFKAVETILKLIEEDRIEIKKLKKQIKKLSIKKPVISEGKMTPIPKPPKNFVKRPAPNRKMIIEELQSIFDKRVKK